MQNQESKTSSADVASVSVKVYFGKGISVSISNKSLRDALFLVYRTPVFEDYEPLKLIFKSTGKVLYMDRNVFMAFLDNQIDMQELIEKTECLDVMRNTKQLKTEDGEVLYEGSLWKKTAKEMILINDDEYITAPKAPLLFESIC